MRKIVTSAAAALVFVLGLAWRHDNRTGACLPLAILFLIVLAVMFVLIYMLMLTAPH